jgi:hypothetical protein
MCRPESRTIHNPRTREMIALKSEIYELEGNGKRSAVKRMLPAETVRSGQILIDSVLFLPEKVLQGPFGPCLSSELTLLGPP